MAAPTTTVCDDIVTQFRISAEDFDLFSELLDQPLSDSAVDKLISLMNEDVIVDLSEFEAAEATNQFEIDFDPTHGVAGTLTCTKCETYVVVWQQSSVNFAEALAATADHRCD